MTRAQSETVGMVLLVGTVVLLVSVVGYYLLGSVAVDPAPTADVVGTVTDDAVTLVHGSGDDIPGAELTVLLRYGGAESRYDFAADGSYGDDAVFEPGERWQLDGAVPFDAGDRVEMLLLHDPSGTVLFSGRKVAATPTPTPTPAPPAAVEPTRTIRRST